MLLWLSKFLFFCPFPPSTPQSISQSPHLCLCPWSSVYLATPFPILCFTSPWLFRNYVFVLLNSLASSPIPHTHLPSGNHQNALHIMIVSALLVCLVWILDLFVDRYAFIAVLLFLVLIFLFLNKSL